MRLALVAAALLAASACSTEPGFKTERDLACAEPYLPWAGGLTFALTQGDGGVFDYDPLGLETRMFGTYDLASGDFGYGLTYPPAHWREETEVDGYGYAHTDGDLDIVGTRTTTDVLDEESTVDFRYERFGCNVTYQVVDEAGNLSVEEGQFSGGAYRFTTTYEPVSGSGYAYDGERRADGTYTESYDLEDGTYTYVGEAEGDGEGYEETEWESGDTAGDWTAEGTTEVFVDGSIHEEYDYESPDSSYTWEYEYDYEGDGEGTIEGADFDCEVVYDDFECEYDCGSGWQAC